MFGATGSSVSQTTPKHSQPADDKKKKSSMPTPGDFDRMLGTTGKA